MHYKELLRLNPQVKVILSVRDPDKWYDSAHETIMANIFQMVSGLYVLHRIPWVATMTQGLVDSWVTPVFGSTERLRDRQYCIELYKNHVEEVKRVVPPAQLLLFDPRQGWDPLCKFLEKKVPETPFPHANDTAEFKSVMRRIDLVDRLMAGSLVLLSIGAAAGVAAYLRRC